MRTVTLLLSEWTAAIPSHWPVEVQFAPADQHFTNMAGQKFMALKGSQLRGEGAAVNSLFDALIAHGYAQEVVEKIPDAPKQDSHAEKKGQ